MSASSRRSSTRLLIVSSGVPSGDLVTVAGRLRQENWTADDKSNRTSYSVVGSIEFLAPPKTAVGYPDRAEGTDTDVALAAATDLDDVPF